LTLAGQKRGCVDKTESDENVIEHVVLRYDLLELAP